MTDRSWLSGCVGASRPSDDPFCRIQARVLDFQGFSLYLLAIAIPGPDCSDFHSICCLRDVLKTLHTIMVAPRELCIYDEIQMWLLPLKQLVSLKRQKIQSTLLNITPRIPNVVIDLYYA